MRKNDVLIKGTKEGILVALGEGDDYLALKRRLEERLGSFARFFTGTEVTLEVGRRHLTPSQLRELEEIITREHGMRVLRVRPGRVLEDAGPEKVPVEGRPTGVVKRTLRSGQRVAYDGNLVLFGDVHPGAEVVASGDVVVLGSLYGVAHAGARGAEDAVVAALRLRPTQIRIGVHIGRPPEDDPPGEEGPEIARVRDGQIVVERYAAMKMGGQAERRETAWAKSS
ncbi:MAG: septum site-determining protein MinC [Firmicutes bacterium]|nr:septum site-determining protein MinC [Bacillota bacterium]